MLTPTSRDTSQLTTSITGLLKGNGSGVVVASAGTDYAGLASTNNFTGTNTFTSSYRVNPSGSPGTQMEISNISSFNTDCTLLFYPGTNTNSNCRFLLSGKGTGDTGGQYGRIDLCGEDYVANGGTNFSALQMGCNPTSNSYILSYNAGTASVLPLILYCGVGNLNQLYLSTSGQVGVNGVPSSGVTFHVVSGAYSGNLDSPTYASTISLAVSLANVHAITTVNATGNATINAATVGVPGQEMTLIITNDATSGKTITFGTHFRSTGTLTGTTSKAATIKFASDGTVWYETSRTLNL